MSTIKKINRMPIVVQKLDPKMLELKKNNIELQISIHKLKKIIEEQEKKLRKSKIIMKKMDCVIHVLSEKTSKNFYYSLFYY